MVALHAALAVACSRRPQSASARSPASDRVEPVVAPGGPPRAGLVPVRLPPPFHTPSVHNPAPVVARPPGASLRAPPGFRVQPWADGFRSARWLALAPNGDVFVSEHAQRRIVVLRDADGDGVPEQRETYATRLNLPLGMAFHPSGWLYVACTDAVVRFRYRPGDRVAPGPPETIASLPGLGYRQHWTRNLVFAPDGRTLYVTVGSETNVSPEADPRRAAISAYELDGSRHRVFAGGLRNPLGMAFHPATGALYAVVNERDELGDDLVPDFLTAVREGAFYGWPYAYFGPHEDPRRAGERPDLVAATHPPDLSLGAHVAALGLLFHSGTGWPAAYRGDALVTLHGSWNRSQRVGYKVVRVRFRDGVPTGAIEDFVTGWHLPDGTVWGRPAGILELRDGSVLVVDDTSNAIFRVIHDGASAGSDRGDGAAPGAL